MADTTSQLQSYRKIRRKRARVVTIVAAALLLLAIVIGAISYYGDHVGNFVVSVEKDSRVALTLSETNDFANPRDLLLPKGVTNQTNTSFFALPMDLLNGSEGGEHSDIIHNEFFAYTFYLKNASKDGRMVDYDIKISLRSTSKNVDEALRVMLVRNRDIYDETGKNINSDTGNRWIFAKSDINPETGNRITDGGKNITTTYDKTASYESTLFESKSRVGTIPIKAFPAGEVTTYTIVMWLEGDDPDCTDEIRGGAVMLDMEFAIANISES